jgi:hypothetical protein
MACLNPSHAQSASAGVLQHTNKQHCSIGKIEGVFEPHTTIENLYNVFGTICVKNR